MKYLLIPQILCHYFVTGYFHNLGGRQILLLLTEAFVVIGHRRHFLSLLILCVPTHDLNIDPFHTE